MEAFCPTLYLLLVACLSCFTLLYGPSLIQQISQRKVRNVTAEISQNNQKRYDNSFSIDTSSSPLVE